MNLTILFIAIIFTTVINISFVASSTTELKSQKLYDAEAMRILNEADKKQLCHYRLSCYTKNNIELSEKQREKQGHLLSSKLVPPKGRKNTMKSAANIAVKKIVQREAEGKVLRKQYGKDRKKVLTNFWTELERKNKCKYRRSCYQTGVLPNIRQSAFLKWLSGNRKDQNQEAEENNKTDETQIKSFENRLEQKVYCQYRRSCYETGVRSKIQSNMDLGYIIRSIKFWCNNLAAKLKKRKEIQVNKEREEIMEEIDQQREQQSRLECKYRKSCYASGELPPQLRETKNDEIETITEKILGGKKVPTSVKELKLFCKYRKSCYLASATGTNVIERQETKKIVEEQTEGGDLKAVNKTTKKMEEKSKPPKNNAAKNKEIGIGHAKPAFADMNNEKQNLAAKGESKKVPKTNCVPEKSTPSMKKNKVEKQEGCKRELSSSIGAKMQKIKKNEKQDFSIRKSPIKTKRNLLINEIEEREEKQQQRKDRKHKKYIDKVQDENDELQATENKNNESIVVKEEIKKVKDKKQKKYGIVEDKLDENEELKVVKTWAKRGIATDKLQCRYRKSCYRTGILPNHLARGGTGEWLIKWPAEGAQMCLAFFVNLIGSKKLRVDESDRRAEGWIGMSEREQMLRCKYRKSCYEEMNMHIGLKKQKPRIVIKIKKEEQKVKKKFAETIKKQVKKEEARVKVIKRLSSGIKAVSKQVDSLIKLKCKYRKSCYETGAVPEVMKPSILLLDRLIDQPKNATAEKLCNPWRISCRQTLGLPIKEKAPIGPNGKKLCRKKTMEIKRS